MILGIHHTAISVPDIEEATRFYCDAFGFEVVERGEWETGNDTINQIVGLKDSAAKQRMLKASNAFVELFEYVTPRGENQSDAPPVCNHGYTHFCLQVDDIYKEHKRLEAAGMRFHTAPQDLETCYATYGRDPFGNVIEIYEIKGDALPRLPGT